MYQVVRTSVRPNLTVDFLETRNLENPVHLDHFIKNYVRTEKHLFRTVEIDETGLIQTTIIVWDSKETWDAFLVDPVMVEMQKTLDDICASRGITREITSLTELA